MKKSDLFLGLLAGMAAGVVISILYAPDSGSATRRKLFKKGGKVVEDLKDSAYVLAAYANQLNNEIDRLADQLEDDIVKATNEARERVEKYFQKTQT